MLQNEKAPPPVIRPRVCSGGCSFFLAEYDRGRKIAGVGTCQKHDSQLPVQVGNLCLWLRFHHEPVAPAEEPTALPC